jgi:hypothetical protein
MPFGQQCVPNVPPPPPQPCPTCNPCIPQGCLVNITTDCVTTINPYPCIGVASGTILTTVLDKINALLCNISGSCQVKVSKDDNCCDYLGTKVTSTGGSITITTPIDPQTGCQTLNLEAANPIPGCIGKVFVTANDKCCDYLAVKITGSDGITVSTVSGEGGCETLNIAGPDLSCLGKVKVDNIDTCDFLSAKFTSGSVVPQVAGSLISFINQVVTFAGNQGTIATQSGCVPANFIAGTLIGPAWVITRSPLTWMDVTWDAGTKRFSVKKGIYNVSLTANHSWRAMGGGETLNFPCYIRTVIVERAGGSCAGCSPVIAEQITYCDSQTTLYSSAITDGLVVTPLVLGGTVDYEVYIYAYVQTSLGTLASLTNLAGNVNISFQKVG